MNGSVSLAQRPAVAAAERRLHLRHDCQRNFTGGFGAEVEADRRVQA
jgi:hypothetical protein